MARPKKEGLDYFPHDTYAQSSDKIEPLVMLHGAAGYALYFMLLEFIYREPNFTLDISDAETREETRNLFCMKLKINVEEYEKIFKWLLKKGCFDKKLFYDEGKLTSAGIQKRASVVVEKRLKMRQTYADKKTIVSEAETMEETAPETTQSKVKIKEKKSKRKEYTYTKEFLFFWETYPEGGRWNQEQTFKNWLTLIEKKNVSVETIMKSATNYANYCTDRSIGGQYFKRSTNFLGKEEEYKNYIEPIKTKVVNHVAIKKQPARQMGNFKQREYTEDEYDSLYEN